MFKKLKLYFQYFWFCWKARNLLADMDIFMSLPEDSGPKYNLEIRNLNRKIRNRARNETQQDGVTKSQYLRLLMYQTFNDQSSTEFDEDLQLPFVLLAAWAISRKSNSSQVENLIIEEQKEE